MFEVVSEVSNSTSSSQKASTTKALPTNTGGVKAAKAEKTEAVVKVATASSSTPTTSNDSVAEKKKKKKNVTLDNKSVNSLIGTLPLLPVGLFSFHEKKKHFTKVKCFLTS